MLGYPSGWVDDASLIGIQLEMAGVHKPGLSLRPKNCRNRQAVEAVVEEMDDLASAVCKLKVLDQLANRWECRCIIVMLRSNIEMQKLTK